MCVRHPLNPYDDDDDDDNDDDFDFIYIYRFVYIILNWHVYCLGVWHQSNGS